MKAVDTAWNGFGRRLGNYRDCLHHYVPLDFGITSAYMERHKVGVWTARIRIPDNPEARSKAAFTFAGNLDALEYCIEALGVLAHFSTTVVDAAATPAAGK